MKGMVAGLLLLIAGASATATAQVPDPRDSIILESKTIAPGLSGNPVAFTMKVYITNRDTIAILTLALRESTLTGDAYAQLDSTGGNTDYLTAWSFGDCVTFLKNTLDNNPAEDFSQYDGTSPDQFLVAATFSPTWANPARDAEPPNAVRSAIWELQFMSTTQSLGEIEFDTSRMAASTSFLPLCHCDLFDEFPVNFAKSIISLQPVKGDMNLDSKFRPADVVLLLNCVMLGVIPPVGLGYCDLNCDGEGTIADIVLELNAVYREEEFPC